MILLIWKLGYIASKNRESILSNFINLNKRFFDTKQNALYKISDFTLLKCVISTDLLNSELELSETVY